MIASIELLRWCTASQVLLFALALLYFPVRHLEYELDEPLTGWPRAFVAVYFAIVPVRLWTDTALVPISLQWIRLVWSSATIAPVIRGRSGDLSNHDATRFTVMVGIEFLVLPTSWPIAA